MSAAFWPHHFHSTPLHSTAHRPKFSQLQKIYHEISMTGPVLITTNRIQRIMASLESNKRQKPLDVVQLEEGGKSHKKHKKHHHVRNP